MSLSPHQTKMKLFTLQMLRKKAKEGNLHAQGKNKILFILTDTVMAELDSLLGKAKKNGEKNLEQGILRITSESKGVIHSPEFSPFVERLSASFDALLAVDPLAGTTARSDNRTSNINTFNDRLIINIALYWYRKHNRPCSCVFVTRDKNAFSTARAERLPVINLKDLDNNLAIISQKNGQAKEWTADLIRQACAPAFCNPDGALLSDPAPPPRSLANHLSTATKTVEGMLQIFAELLPDLNDQEKKTEIEGKMKEYQVHLLTWKKDLAAIENSFGSSNICEIWDEKEEGERKAEKAEEKKKEKEKEEEEEEKKKEKKKKKK
eukprot:CAMPEP_0201542008 /NCGR_PEP_ID=MMETSP0161_2-20130828/71788_1 /ASSEMBLY_ACC=CAM_ASM_000251 /TAXON_ID=180227 /ORGANISM="Neoparamoeba aestuarina, Strain SoJaBio B1-5/56/2" /LENGTH=321 /DNA_ID=CAMNT_0047949595 /DNA_START=904 /DNA_END=1867 /DNA_ORIENTATION=-